jgi:hypothetical protein
MNDYLFCRSDSNGVVDKNSFCWNHFGLGIAFGAGVGTWISWGLFEQVYTFAAATLLISIAVGYSCGRWGERAWEWIVDNFWWFT